MSCSPTITDLAANFGSDKHWFHRYSEVYDLVLDRHRPTTGRILEIGVHHGESVRLWRDAFPAATIIGVDLDPPPGDIPGVELVAGDAYTAEAIDLLDDGIPFDIIIDDGAHTLDTMRFVVRRYLELLDDRGTLIIEDVLDEHWPAELALELAAGDLGDAYVITRNIVPPLRGTAGAGRASRMLIIDRKDRTP